MPRHYFALLLLAAALSAQATAPARENANSSGGNCPPATAVALSGEAEDGTQDQTEAAPTVSKPTATPPSSGKSPVLPRPNKTGARWHTFLPGMFK